MSQPSTPYTPGPSQQYPHSLPQLATQPYPYPQQQALPSQRINTTQVAHVAQGNQPSSTVPVHSSTIRRKAQSFRGTFTRELRSMMYAFGDEENPASDTVSVMEEIAIEYILDLSQTASRTAPNKNRLGLDDIKRALSHPADAKELARMEEILFLAEDIKRARAQFKEVA